MAAMELDNLDRIAAEAFEGYIVRKDLVRKFARQYPVPTYVCEFLLGRYCASVDEDEIQEGLQIVERQLRDRAVRSGEEELFKARARETGMVKIIDIISARLDTKTNSFLATLPSLQLKDVCIGDRLVHDNERMLTGGFYAELDLSYDAVIALAMSVLILGREVLLCTRSVDVLLESTPRHVESTARCARNSMKRSPEP